MTDTESVGAASVPLAGLALLPSDLLLVPAAAVAAAGGGGGGALCEGEALTGSGGKILAINATTCNHPPSVRNSSSTVFPTQLAKIPNCLVYRLVLL